MNCLDCTDVQQIEKGIQKKDKENDKERLKYNENNKDDSGELLNLLLLVFMFVMYRIYIQWKRERSGTINNKIGRGI